MTGTVLVAIAVILRVISNPLANVYQKQLTSKGNNPLIVNFLTYFLLSLFCGILLFFIQIPDLGKDFWLYSILGGIAGAMGNGFLVKALQTGDLSILGSHKLIQVGCRNNCRTIFAFGNTGYLGYYGDIAYYLWKLLCFRYN